MSLLASKAVRWCGGGWCFFIAENAVMSENRAAVIDAVGEKGYRGCYGALSTASLASIAYGYVRHGPGPRLAAGPPSAVRLAAGLGCHALGFAAAANVAPKLRSPLDPGFLSSCPLDLEHERAALGRVIGVPVRGQTVRALDDRGDQRRLCDSQVGRPLPEQEVGRLADAVDRGGAPAPQVDLVQIGLEDGPLVVTRLHEQRHHRFGRLALQRPLRRQEEVLDQLLRQGTSTLGDPTGPQVRHERSGDPPRVDAHVGFEATVLHREDGIDQVRRHLVQRNEVTLLAMAPIEGANPLGLEQDRPNLASARELSDLLDDAAATARVAGVVAVVGVRSRRGNLLRRRRRRTRRG